MEHFVILYFVIALIIGFTVLIIAIILFNKYRFKSILCYLYLLLVLNINFLLNIFNFYNQIIIINKSLIYNFIYLLLKISAQGITFYVIPLFGFTVYQIPLNKIKKIIFLFLTSISALFVIYLIFIPLDLENRIAFAKTGLKFCNLIRIIIIIYCLTYYLIKRKEILNPEIKLLSRSLRITTSIVIPFIILDSFFPIFKFYWNNTVISTASLEIFYTVWNTVNLFLIAYYYKYKNFKNEEIISFVASEYKITEREKEIIFLIAKGMSNQEIGDKLFISIPTVKTHIRNIYQKTKVKNRVGLLNLIKN